MTPPFVLDPRVDLRLPVGYGGLFYGVYPAEVVDVTDPEGQGRVKVRLPWAPDTGSASYEVWARLATMMAGNDRGTWFVPDVEDEVLVAFAAGDPRFPFVVGALWNGRDTPPESMDRAGRNDIKAIHSRSGVKIVLDDAAGAERLLLETPGGQRVTLADGGGSITVEDSNGNSVKLESSGITITAASKVTVQASTVEVSAASVTVNAGMSRFSGVVQADTVVTNSIVAASYTPGAGNIW
ncbi:phage baseplate assembly protein V [Myxococcota bacterium]|nr:phage baseplate assembly protein V [Myxococcota bacterium]